MKFKILNSISAMVFLALLWQQASWGGPDLLRQLSAADRSVPKPRISQIQRKTLEGLARDIEKRSGGDEESLRRLLSSFNIERTARAQGVDLAAEFPGLTTDDIVTLVSNVIHGKPLEIDTAQPKAAAQIKTTSAPAGRLGSLLGLKDEHKIEEAIRGMNEDQLAALRPEIAARYHVQDMLNGDFVKKLNPAERCLLKVYLERDLSIQVRLFCDNQFIRAGDRLRTQGGDRQTCQKFAWDYMSAREGVRLDAILQKDEAALGKMLSDFEGGIRNGLKGKTIRAFRFLDFEGSFNELSSFPCYDFNSVLRALGSDIRITAGALSTGVPVLSLGETREVDHVNIFTREIAPSPVHTGQRHFAWHAGTDIFVRESAIRDEAIEFYYFIKGGQRYVNNVVMFRHPETIRPFIARAFAAFDIKDDKDFFERVLPEIVEASMNLSISHEKGHAERVRSKFSGDLQFHALIVQLGNQFGYSLEECAADVIDGGPVDYVTKLAGRDPRKANFAFWYRFAEQAESLLEAKEEKELGADAEGLLLLFSYLLQHIDAHGDVDFAALKKGRAEWYEFSDKAQDEFMLFAGHVFKNKLVGEAVLGPSNKIRDYIENLVLKENFKNEFKSLREAVISRLNMLIETLSKPAPKRAGRRLKQPAKPGESAV